MWRKIMRKKFLALLSALCLLMYVTPDLMEVDALGQSNILTWSTPGMYTYTIPRTGMWELECWGAEGGFDNVSGGPGSYISGYFRLEKGTVLQICVGPKGGCGGGLPFNAVGGGGGTGSHGWSGQGGGATYAIVGGSPYLHNHSAGDPGILIVAGGGGGATCGVGGGGADGGRYGAFGYGYTQHGDGGGGGGGYYGGLNAPDGSQATGGSSYVNTGKGTRGTWNKACSWGGGTFRISLHGYYITFDKNTPAKTHNKVKGTMEDQYMLFGVPDTLHKNQYSLKGYVWMGWTEYPNGTGTQYSDQQLVLDK